MQNFFFIIGVGRSGTSLLQSILSSHSKVSIPPETGFLRKNILSGYTKKNLTFKELVSLNPRLERLATGIPGDFPAKFSSELEFYEYLMQEYKKEQGKFLAGDKDPRLIEYINISSRLFPQAKFIHLIRDPRDVLLSKKKAAWSKGKPAWYHIFANYIQLKMGEYAGNKLSDERYFTITYEHILKSSENCITRVCDFLQIEFEPTMLSFQEKAKELVAEDEKQWKKETMGPLLVDNTNKWKRQLEPWEIIMTEKLCDQAFTTWKYEKSNIIAETSILTRVLISVSVVALKGVGSLYMAFRLLSQKIILKWKF